MSKIKVNSLEGVGASTPAITIDNTSGTCSAKLTNRTNKNLIINGAMQVAQRGTSSTSSNYQTVDRFLTGIAVTNESPTTEQVDVASGTTPYTLGFRKAYKITNGNQTSGAGAANNIYIMHKIEAQNMATSGWNYTSSSSFITLSFWVKSSVAQNFYGYLKTVDGTSQRYAFETGSLSADTWTKITKTISGNSNLQFDNNNERGLDVVIIPFWGTDQTDSGVPLNAWGAFSSTTRTPDSTSTWYTTNDATFEVTGVQLEVGHGTDFEHRSFGDELARCQRYYFRFTTSFAGTNVGIGYQMTSSAAKIVIPFPTSMRTRPTALETTGTASDYTVARTSTYEVCNAVPTFAGASKEVANVNTNQTSASVNTGQAVALRANTTDFFLGFSAEL